MRDRANATATALEHGVKSAGILHKTHTVCVDGTEIRQLLHFIHIIFVLFFVA